MGFGLSDEVAKTRVDAFKKENPDVDLTITEGAFDEQQFLSAVASGNPPDVVYMDRKLVGTYASRGSIQPLDGCVDGALLDGSVHFIQDDVDEALLAHLICISDGQSASLP